MPHSSGMRVVGLIGAVVFVGCGPVLDAESGSRKDPSTFELTPLEGEVVPSSWPGGLLLRQTVEACAQLTAVGDFDGDGFSDLLFRHVLASHDFYLEPLVAWGAPKPATAAAPDVLLEIDPRGQLACDVDGDGTDNLIAVLDGAVVMFPPGQRWSASTRPQVLHPAGSEFAQFLAERTVACGGDIDGDGFEDIVLLATGGLSLMVAHGSEDWIAAPQARVTIISPPSTIIGGSPNDLDRDGVPDLVAVRRNAGDTRTVHVVPGGSVEWGGHVMLTDVGYSRVVADSSVTSVAVDGNWDRLIAYEQGTPPRPVVVSLEGGALVTSELPLQVEGEVENVPWQVYGIGDLDGDGSSELATATLGDLGNSTMIWFGAAQAADFPDVRIVSDENVARNVGDVNADGFDDILLTEHPGAKGESFCEWTKLYLIFGAPR